MTRRIDASLACKLLYTLRSVLNDLVKRKFGTLLTILVIAVSLYDSNGELFVMEKFTLSDNSILSGKLSPQSIYIKI